MNFRRLYATFVKEGILLVRDWPGLIMLFIMPLALIVIMAIIQDIPFRDYQDVRFDVLYVDEDKRSLSDSLLHFLQEADQFNIVRQIEGEDLSAGKLRELITRGHYSIGIIIPPGVYAEMANKTNRIVNEMGRSMGQPAIIPVRPSVDSIQIQLLFDPAAKNTYRLAVKKSLEVLLFKAQFGLLMDKVSGVSSDSENIVVRRLSSEQVLANTIGEQNLGRLKENDFVLNSVQHNVPAWIVFAIFFLVMPLAGNYIKEREAGSRIRIAMTPGSYLDILGGKVLLYCLLAMTQFVFLIAMSKIILPLVGLPDLVIGDGGPLIVLAAIPIGFAAICLGFLIGSYFKTYHQAMMFGAILIIIMSALGGIWIPVDVLPGWMQRLAMMSPLHWGLELINDLFLRGVNWQGFLMKSGILFMFGLLCILPASWLHGRR